MQAGALAIAFLGGLAIFLFGMQQMTGALQRVVGDRGRAAIARLTGNRVTAMLTGAAVTAAVQSSSVTTVLCIGFVSAGLMSLGQSVGVVLGANVGTTVNAQIVAFNIGQVALLLVAAGFALQFAGRGRSLEAVGSGVMGLGMLFLGMTFMGEATAPLRGWSPFIDFMARLDRPLLGVLTGAAFTAVIQSSAATVGIVIVLAAQGLVGLEGGIALVLGSNVGTCVTALLSAFDKPRAALQVAVVHLLFNAIGALAWLPFTGQLASLVRTVSPSHPELVGLARLASEAPRQIANAHTIFNVVNAGVFLFLTGALARTARWLVPDQPAEAPPRATPQYLDDMYLQSPPAAIAQLRLEIARLGGLVASLYERLSTLELGSAARRSLTAESGDLARLYEAIVLYARKLLLGKLSTADIGAIERLLSIANDFHAIADTVSINLDELIRLAVQHRLQASPETARLLRQLHAAVGDCLTGAVRAVRDQDRAAAETVIAAKPDITARADALSSHLAHRVTAEGSQRLALYRMESDLIEYLKRIYYFAKRAAKAMAVEIAGESGADARIEEAG